MVGVDWVVGVVGVVDVVGVDGVVGVVEVVGVDGVVEGGLDGGTEAYPCAAIPTWHPCALHTCVV